MWLLIGQIIVGVLLTALVLIQAQGTGLGKAWGGSGVSYHSKKGLERYLFWLTIFLAALFTLLAIINLVR